MANPEHLGILKKGVEVWNKWRKENEVEDVHLRGANLSGANLSRASLSRASLSRASLCDANLNRADLSRAYLSSAKLNGANFGGANLDKANFEKTDLRGLNIASTNLLAADEEGTKLSESLRKEKKLQELRLIDNTLDETAPDQRPGIKPPREDLSVETNAVNPEMLEKAVIDLIEKVKSSINLDQIKAICKHQHGIEKIDKIDCTRGDIVTHQDQVAFKLDFKVSYNLSLLVDRKGDFIKKAESKA